MMQQANTIQEVFLLRIGSEIDRKRVMVLKRTLLKRHKRITALTNFDLYPFQLRAAPLLDRYTQQY